MSTAVCDTCNGSGSKPGSKKSKCRTCNGTGYTNFNDGMFAIQTVCSVCGGSGEVIRDPCNTCSGTGAVRKKRTLKVDFPSGIEDGSTLRLRDQGNNIGKGVPPGHLFVQVKVMPSDTFARRGNDVYVDVPLNLGEAVLGGDVRVRTLYGDVLVKVPPGTQSEDGQRLRGRGIRNNSTGGVGHQFITFKVKIPKNINSKQKKLLEEFIKAGSEGAHPPEDPNKENTNKDNTNKDNTSKDKNKTFFDKMKDKLTGKERKNEDEDESDQQQSKVA